MYGRKILVQTIYFENIWIVQSGNKEVPLSNVRSIWKPLQEKTGHFPSVYFPFDVKHQTCNEKLTIQ